MSPNPPAARVWLEGPRVARVKPRLRGVSHEIAAYVSLPVVAGLVASARGRPAVAGAVTYGSTLVLVFVASAVPRSASPSLS